MSEFKFSCPACGQHISCGTTHVGTQIACPSCNATITVPEETAGAADVSAPPASPGDITATAQRTSGLAIASLICSLLSFITCVGWLPGIICGHLAKSRIRRDPSLKGGGLATAGIIIGYSFLLLLAGIVAVKMWHFSIAAKHGLESVRQVLATNNVVVAQTQSTTVSNASKQPGSVEPVAVPAPDWQIEPDKSGWTSDISTVSFPDHPVSGKLHGLDFVVKTTSFRNGDLRIRSANGVQLDVYRLGASIEGRSYEIQPGDDDSANPRVKISWNEGDAFETATFNKGYGMKLQFSRAANRTVSGKIYLCFPDDSKSCVAGTFQVRLTKQQ
jgi:ribosomal protein S27E